MISDKERDKLKRELDRVKFARNVLHSAASEGLPWLQDGPIWKERAEKAESLVASLAKERDELKEENLRLSLQGSHVECYFDVDDCDHRYDSAEEYADEQGLKIGDEFTLQAGQYWEEKFRVTKRRDETSDDYECEEIGKKRTEFPEYMAVKTRAETAESRVESLEKALREIERETAGVLNGIGPNRATFNSFSRCREIVLIARKALESELTDLEVGQ